MTEISPLWSIRDFSLAIGSQVIFDDTSFCVRAGERLGVVGRNGCGKSTLLRIIRGELQVPGAAIGVARELRIGILPQDFELDETLTIGDNIRCGFADISRLRREFESPGCRGERHDVLERQLMLLDAWNLDTRVEMLADKLRIAGIDRLCRDLSGGEKRRIALARALAGAPDLLLLDEPTNHLDVRTVQWIEDFLSNYRGAALFVTHDRRFLDRLSTRIVELDHGKFYSYDGSYGDFIAGKEARENAEDAMDETRRKFLRSEIEWVRKSPKARLRRNVGRLKQFESLAAIRDHERTGSVDLVLPAPRRMGDRAVELAGVSVALGGKKLLCDFSCEFPPGAKVGLVGANGAGKTTLLRLIAGELAPDAVKRLVAPTVEFNYIDQNRESLNGENTVREEISGGVDTVDLGTEKVSVWGYLRRFLFEDERINTQVKFLSGGEKARLLLAKQLKHGGNFLLLDEPTNDLDLSTLRILEEALMRFPGSLLLVSHDRYFLNRVCDKIIVFEGGGRTFSTVGDYDYALEKLRERQAAADAAAAPAGGKPRNSAPAAPPPKRQPKNALSYKENLELEGMESAIAAAEEQVAELEKTFSDQDFFAKHGAKSSELQQLFAEAKSRVEKLYARWEELEAKRAAAGR